MPQTIYIFSDMEFDSAMICNSMSSGYGYRGMNHGQIDTLIEKQVDKWRRAGYKAQRIIFWNLRAAHPNIPAIGDGFSYVSGYSPVMIENILSGKDGIDLMLDKLNSVRYERIVSISNIPF
jgi:hypothetical protein